jgi:hypothetical protein
MWERSNGYKDIPPISYFNTSIQNEEINYSHGIHYWVLTLLSDNSTLRLGAFQLGIIKKVK